MYEYVLDGLQYVVFFFNMNAHTQAHPTAYGRQRQMCKRDKLQKRSPRSLFEIFVEEAVAAENLSQRRLFLYAVLAGARIFPDEANLRLGFDGDQDVVTQDLIDSELQKLEETL